MLYLVQTGSLSIRFVLLIINSFQSKMYICIFQSVIDHFGTIGKNMTEVNAFLNDNKLIVTNDWSKGQPVKLKVSSFYDNCSGNLIIQIYLVAQRYTPGQFDQYLLQSLRN